MNAEGAAAQQDLERLQATLAAGILGREDGFLAAIGDSPGLAPRQRLEIYSNAYRSRLADALQDSFGHTAVFLGDGVFRGLALEYVDGHPSGNYNIRWYGGQFPAWLRDTHRQHREVAELAALDWALRAAFDSEDARPLVAADLAALNAEDWDQVGFDLHPSFQLLNLRYNSVALWHALDRDLTPPPFQALPDPVALLVWRRELRPHFRSLEADEAEALRALHRGTSFAGICAGQAQRRGQEAAVALTGLWLRRWIEEALLAGVRR